MRKKSFSSNDKHKCTLILFLCYVCVCVTIFLMKVMCEPDIGVKRPIITPTPTTCLLKCCTRVQRPERERGIFSLALFQERLEST